MRRPYYTFVGEDEESPRKAFCRVCDETEGKLNKLVPRYVNDVLDDKFKVCGYCGEVYPIYDVQFLSEYEPRAVLVDYGDPFASGTNVAVASEKRRTRVNDRPTRDFDNDIDIPKLAGKKDELLENALNEGAIIVSIRDSNNEDEEEE